MNNVINNEIENNENEKSLLAELKLLYKYNSYFTSELK